jgi:hypothetical protein
MFNFLKMAINEKTTALSELFDIKTLPEYRIIISPDGDVLTPISPYCASRILDISYRNLEDDDPLPAKTTKGHDCYVVYFEPGNTRPDDWSQTELAIIEDRGVSGIHMAFIELSSTDGHHPNTPGTEGITFTGHATIKPASNILRESLYPMHYRDFETDGFFDLSRSHIAREDFFRNINECAGNIPLTRTEELAFENAQYAGEFRVTKSVREQMHSIQNRISSEIATTSANDQLRRIIQQTTKLDY